MKVATSILNADFNNLEKELKKIESSDYIHLDVMDGHFVPNISFGYPVLRNIKKLTNVPLDTHLMISNPYDYIDNFAKLGSCFITIHVEANKPLETIKLIKDKGIKSGITLKPKTKLSDIYSFLPIVDLVLVMTVEPGFGGQSFMVDQVEKIKELDRLRKKHNYSYLIEADGGINGETIKYLKNSGVDIVVSGTYITNSDNPEAAIKSLK